MNIWRFNNSSLDRKNGRSVGASGSAPGSASTSTGSVRRSVSALLLMSVLGLVAGPLCPAFIGGHSSVALAAGETLVVPQNLGNPFGGKPAIYARNVWDMQSYNGKIYLGHGDSSANSGNTPIWSLDPKSGSFANEYTTTSEQVDEFFPLSDGLYTLDHDPTGVNNGNLYCNKGGKWSVEKNIYSAVHEYSIIEKSGAIYVGGSGGGQNTVGGYSVWRSVDNGRNWSDVLTGEIKLPQFNVSLWGARVYTLMNVKNELYAVRQGWLSDGGAGEVGFYRLNEQSGKFEQSPVPGATLSGGLKFSGESRYKRLVTLDDGGVLTLLVENVNDHQWDPISLIRINEISAKGISALSLPGKAKPYDILRRGNLVYVCAWDEKKQQNCVFSLPTSDLGAKATEVLRFDAPTFARSFEESEGNFYFGLGCDVSPTPAETGQIWKVALGSSPKVPVVPEIPTVVPTPNPSPTPLPPVVEPKTDPSLAPGLSARYYKGMALQGSAVLQRTESNVNFNVGNNVAVVPEVGGQQWSVSYEGFLEAPITGQIKLWTVSDDGVRLLVGDNRVIDNWTNHGTAWDCTTLDVVRGQKLPIKLQYFQNTGNSTLQFFWEWNGKRALVPQEYLWHNETAPPVVPPVVPPITPTPLVPVTPTEPVAAPGLSARYYKGMALQGAAVLQRTESNVNFNVGNNVAVVPEVGGQQWSVSYEGFLEAPITGQIKLWTVSDDGVRLLVGDNRVIDNWTNHGTAWDCTTLDVVRGQKLPIKLQYFQNTGNSTLQFFWEWDIQRRVIVPAAALSHTE